MATVTPEPTASPVPTLVPLGKDLYLDERLGLSFSYPSNWGIDATDPTSVQLFPNFGGFVTVQANLAGPTGLESQLTQLLGSLSGFPNVREISRTVTEEGAPGYHVSIEWTDQGTPVRGDFVLVVQGARVYFLSAVAWEFTFKEHEADFMELATSFRLDPSPAGQPVDTSLDTGQMLDDIGERVTRFRGLPAPPALKRAFETSEEFELTVRGKLLDEDSLREVERLGGLCVVLDLCSPSDDLVRTWLRIQSQGVIGFYDLEEKSLTVEGSLGDPDPLAWLIYAHEYTHALQDQQFLLLDLLEPVVDQFDASKAVRALLEGDAILTSYLFYDSLPEDQQTAIASSLEEQIQDLVGSPEVASAPPILLRILGWEHRAGPNLVYRLYLDGGFEAIDRAYENPPRSTEHILHPDKYLSGEEPHDVSLPPLAAALGQAWRQEDGGVLGELLTAVYLTAFLTDDRAEAAARGWGGDRYGLFKDDAGRILIAIRTSWDTTRDAGEFFEAYLDFVANKSEGRWELVETGEEVRFWDGQGTSVYLSLDGDHTYVIVGPDRASVEAVPQAI